MEERSALILILNLVLMLMLIFMMLMLISSSSPSGQKTGYFRANFPSGESFEGHFVNNRRQGEGTWASADGGKYHGDYANDVPSSPSSSPSYLLPPLYFAPPSPASRS